MIKKYNIEFDDQNTYFNTYFDNAVVFYRVLLSIIYKERYLHDRLFGFNIKIKTK